MRARAVARLATAALLVSLLVSSCQVTKTSGPAGTTSDADETVFLDALSGPIRDKYPDSVLIAEGRKACEAFANGSSEDDVEKMIATDLGVDPGQFIGAVYGGMSCFPK